MNCKNCGVELKENAKFCSKCGTKVEPDVCTKCNAPLKAGANFCPKCGTKVNVQANDVSPIKKEEQKTMPSTQVKQKKVEVSPEDIKRSDELTLEGSGFWNENKFDKAILILNKSISLNPENADAFYWRGLTYFSIEEYDRAISDYSEAIRLDQSQEVFYDARRDAYLARGEVYFAKEEYEKAISDLNEFIAGDNTDADVYNNRGNAYFNLSDYSSAIEDYKKAIKLKPKEKLFKNNLQIAEEALQNEGNDDVEDKDEDIEEEESASSKITGSIRE